MGPDDQCAMTVLPAATLVAEHIVRVLPYVRRDRDSLLCFFGYLKNTKDLEEKLDELDLGLNGDDVGASTTGILMGLYRHLNSETKEELLLSELQVCIAMLQCMHHVVFNSVTGPKFLLVVALPLVRGATHFSCTIVRGDRLLLLAIPVGIKSYTSALTLTMGRWHSPTLWSSCRLGSPSATGRSCPPAITSAGAPQRCVSLP